MAKLHRTQSTLPVLPNSATAILDHILPSHNRLLLFGPPGSGKTTLAGKMAKELANKHIPCHCISADPGSPGFGLPGAVILAEWQKQGWQTQHTEALCTLDAGRFRLPLITAVRQLARNHVANFLLIDGPGVVRGVAGRELLTGLVDAASVDCICILVPDEQPIPLEHELRSLGIAVYVVHAVSEALRPGKQTRAHRRTQLWDSYLDTSQEYPLALSEINLLGIPPPVEESSAWQGRQVALLKAHRTVAMGEVISLHGDTLILKLAGDITEADSLLIRDAQRNAQGLLESAEPFSVARFEFVPPPEMLATIEESGGPRVVGRVGSLDVILVNGVFGDPLLHLRIRHKGQSLLFDLGEGGRLSARLAHQVTDVFISHAHMDHLAGFQWLLRSRLGEFPTCRVYGPAGLARHIEGFLQSFLWDRVADRGPCFEVNELHGEVLQRYRLQAGYPGMQKLEPHRVQDGILCQQPGFQIRAIQLDHHTPVLAYAFEPEMEIHVRKDRLAARKLEPGPWLTALKQAVLANQSATVIDLPDGIQATAGVLQQDLTLISPGKKLVYATDLADTVRNRENLVNFAKNAHTFFCEATFLQADADHAERNGHLTTQACGEIASAARVGRLVGFHFSRRYCDRPEAIYDELKAACDRVVLPQSMDVFTPPTTSNGETPRQSEFKIQ